MTNGDRIRQMSNEELAKWLEDKSGFDTCKICDYDNNLCEYECVAGIKAYLESEEEQMSEVKKCCLCDEELCCADDLFEYNDSLSYRNLHLYPI